MKIKSVDEALTEILAEDIEFDRKYHGNLSDCYMVRIQKLARKMHPHYWKYRQEILDKIHEWVKKHPLEWMDNNGNTWKIGYGEQMHPYYGCYKENPNNPLYILGYGYDILELWRVR